MRNLMVGCLLIAATVPAQAADFSYRLLVTDAAKLNRYFDYDSSVDDFMKCFRGPVWTRYQNDEFQLQAKRAETLAQMKAEVASADLDVPVQLVTNVTFGEYDFAKQRFALRPLSDASYYNVMAQCSVTALPGEIRVFFSNPGILDGLPMAADKAKAFLDGRKAAYGAVDRSLQATLTFKITRMKADGELMGEIQKVVLTDLGAQKLGVLYSVPN